MQRKNLIWSSSLQFQVPEKRARFERTADMLAKSGLLDITMKTAELIRSNQQAKNELMKLKVEIDEFVQKVLSNPENQVIQHYWVNIGWEIHCIAIAIIICFNASILYSATTSPACPETVFIKSSSRGRSSRLAEGFSNKVSLQIARTNMINT